MAFVLHRGRPRPGQRGRIVDRDDVLNPVWPDHPQPFNEPGIFGKLRRKIVEVEEEADADRLDHQRVAFPAHPFDVPQIVGQRSSSGTMGAPSVGMWRNSRYWLAITVSLGEMMNFKGA